MRLWSTRLNASYSVGQNCVVFPGNDKEFNDGMVGRGILRHLRRQRVYMFNSGLGKEFELFPYTCILKKGQGGNGGC